MSGCSRSEDFEQKANAKKALAEITKTLSSLALRHPWERERPPFSLHLIGAELEIEKASSASIEAEPHAGMVFLISPCL